VLPSSVDIDPAVEAWGFNPHNRDEGMGGNYIISLRIATSAFADGVIIINNYPSHLPSHPANCQSYSYKYLQSALTVASSLSTIRRTLLKTSKSTSHILAPITSRQLRSFHSTTATMGVHNLKA